MYAFADGGIVAVPTIFSDVGLVLPLFTSTLSPTRCEVARGGRAEDDLVRRVETVPTASAGQPGVRSTR